MRPLHRDLTRALDRGRRRVDALTNDLTQDDPRPADVVSIGGTGPTREQRLDTIYTALRGASLSLDAALAESKATGVRFLVTDIPRVQGHLDELAKALRMYQQTLE